MRTRITATLAALAALAAVVAAPAHAGQANTNVSINFVNRPGPDIFRGEVNSPNPNCRQDRAVRLFRRQQGPDQFIDRDKSEDNGRWSIDVEGDPAPGRYYVKVRAT